MSRLTFCPLCGAHEHEHGEGKPTNEEILLWDEEISELWLTLQELKDDKNARTD